MLDFTFVISFFILTPALSANNALQNLYFQIHRKGLEFRRC